MWNVGKMFLRKQQVHLFKSDRGSFGEATVAYSWKIPTVETLSEFQIEPRLLLYVPNKINKPVLVDVAVHHFQPKVMFETC